MAGNADAFAASLAQLPKRIEEGAAAALRAQVDNVGERANSPGQVPYQSGRLHDSQFIEGPLTGSGRSTVRIGYDTPYAGLVHEQPQEARATGQSKWLESSIGAMAAEMGDRLREKIG